MLTYETRRDQLLDLYASRTTAAHKAIETAWVTAMTGGAIPIPFATDVGPYISQILRREFPNDQVRITEEFPEALKIFGPAQA